MCGGLSDDVALIETLDSPPEADVSEEVSPRHTFGAGGLRRELSEESVRGDGLRPNSL